MAQVAEAIHHAHQRGVLHRDLKPSNILVDERGEPHVIDFGLAKRLEPTASRRWSSTASAVGTPSYMAPEQARGCRDEITTATDVYGLGTMLYALLTGRRRSMPTSAMEILRQVIENEPPAPAADQPPGGPRPGDDLPEMPGERPEAALSRRPASWPTTWTAGSTASRSVPGRPRPPNGSGSTCRRHPVTSVLIGLLVARRRWLGSGGILWQWRQAVAARAATSVRSGRRKTE